MVEGERIVFTTVLKEGTQPCEPWLAMTQVVTMEDAGAHTRYVARVLHANAEDGARHAEMGLMEGWGTVIDQLEVVAGGCGAGDRREPKSGWGRQVSDYYA